MEPSHVPVSFTLSGAPHAMSSTSASHALLRHRHVEADSLSIHVVEGGEAGMPAVLFLHGWPESWAVFERVMASLSESAHVVAIDLPGIGESPNPPPAADKRTLARCVLSVVETLGLQDVTLVGHDVGGMIVYAFLRAYREKLTRAVIMNTVIPGIDPWDEVIHNPFIWHFAFHALPNLPELLVADRQAPYFDYFYDVLSANPSGVDASTRDRYVQANSRLSALTAGFDWYRAFQQDAQSNLASSFDAVSTPVFYLRGDREQGDIEAYLEGLRAAGCGNLTGRVIADCGHFAPDEQPQAVATVILECMGVERNGGAGWVRASLITPVPRRSRRR